MNYTAKENRYSTMEYRRCGKSGLLLPAISLGLWHNFGDETSYTNSKDMLLTAFDNGITHFDIANNYGVPGGSAESNFGRIISTELKPYRDEIIVSTKAGYHMWEGPYGEWGSKKNLIASIDQSLTRLRLDYVDIFYHHRPDENTPLEETVEALVQIVRSGKALYIGISNYNAKDTKKIVKLLAEKGVHCLIHQMRYSLLNRDNEELFDQLNSLGVGGIAFSPLAQGLLSDKYLDGIPEDSRVKSGSVFLTEERLTVPVLGTVKRLNEIAKKREQTLVQMAINWVLRADRATSVLLGASKPEQIIENVKALDSPAFTKEELAEIDSVLKG